MIKYSTTDINKLYDGSAAVNKMYHGSTLSFVKYKGAEPIQPMLKIDLYSSRNGTLLDSISMDDDGTRIINYQKMSTFVQNNPFSADVSNTQNLFKITVGDTVTEYAPFSSTTMNVYDTSGHTRNIINSTFCLIVPNVITYGSYSVYGMYGMMQIPVILDINTSGATFNRNNFVVLNSIISTNKIDLDFSNSTFIGYNDTPNQLYFHFTNSPLIKSLILPSTITSLSYSLNNCSNLEWIEMQSLTPPTIGTNDTSSLTNLPSLTAIYVPNSSVNAYKSANGWSNFASIIQGSQTPTLQWVSLSSGDTIPQGNIYGVKLNSQDVFNHTNLEIGSDSDNCAWFGEGAPTRAPQFYAYFYTIANGVSTLENFWDDGVKEFIFSDYSGASYYYEDGTKTAPYNIQLYMYV